MNRGCKVALGVFLCLGLLGVGACAVVGYSFFKKSKDPSAGQSIMTYTMPAGYEQMFAMNLGGMNQVMLAKSGDPASGMFIQLVEAAGVTSDAQLKQMQDAVATQLSGGGAGGAMSRFGSMQNFKEVGRKKVKVAGQEREMVVSQGTDAAGNSMKMGVLTFKSKSGGGLLNFMGEPKHWDDKLIAEFLASTNSGGAAKPAEKPAAPAPAGK